LKKRDQNQDGQMVNYFEEPVLYYGRDRFEVGSALFAAHLPSASVPSLHLMDWDRTNVAEMLGYSMIEYVAFAFG
jgi:hypothetical protein